MTTARDWSAVHAADLRAAETDLATHRQRLATVVAWINDPAWDLAARTALAQLLNLPAPEGGTTHGPA
ncbi:hypothetical protein ACFV3R_25640 [Streptomyces sp. NPDC059740]|uniref:hypothetical protein n=1 Tax=Streptomyces sp. NPDC059740 TaxID=3346926 RepID=UPI00365A76B1